ncbi:MATE family efflux transporter [Persicobacter psychrovividus]|uniref:Multidrug export protein MepA n=1 Tax=Persicobacter psychrovividus TaxID=387638 RepID=A0ABM7VKI6_9BACT|nr:MATE family efflux transporter [Persicobacter psychrovividus]
MSKEKILREYPINKALLQLSLPAMIGIMVMAMYNIADTMFVGRIVGTEAIGGLSIVLPITMLIAAIGMSIGMGGASIISRHYGAKNVEQARRTFGNLLILAGGIGLVTLAVSLLAARPILTIFGAKGAIFDEALNYYKIVILGAPFMGLAMMGNNVARSEGASKTAMYAMLFSAFLNIILDALFMITFKMGIAGAAWATFIAQVASAAYLMIFFASKKSILSLSPAYWTPDWAIIKETFSIGSSTLARQGAAAIIAAMINNSLVHFGNEFYVAIYGLIYRVMMFTFFPMIGIVQGFIPLVGYNIGAKLLDRVKLTLKTSSIMITAISVVCFVLIFIFAHPIMSLFSKEERLITAAAHTLRIISISLPVIGIQMLGASYYQAIGKALPALFLTLSRQVIFIIPLIIILPQFYGIDGVFYAIPIADFLAFILTMFFLANSWKKLSSQIPSAAHNV